MRFSTYPFAIYRLMCKLNWISSTVGYWFYFILPFLAVHGLKADFTSYFRMITPLFFMDDVSIYCQSERAQSKTLSTAKF